MNYIEIRDYLNLRERDSFTRFLRNRGVKFRKIRHKENHKNFVSIIATKEELIRWISILQTRISRYKHESELLTQVENKLHIALQDISA